MTARVLVVDDVVPNVKLLEAKLVSEYFDVLSAYSGPEALEIVEKESPDIILLDVMMPGMDGFEVCRRLKNNHETAHIPIVMVTALDQPSDRVAGLEAGADDFITKPVQDIALFSRVRSLVRLKVMLDELRNREITGLQLGFSKSDMHEDYKAILKNARILLVEDDKAVSERIIKTLKELGKIDHIVPGEGFIDKARDKAYDLIIVSLTMKENDGLHFCSQLRRYDETRYVPILVMIDDGNTKQMAKALEMGVNDYVVRPIDKLEFLARVKTQLMRKAYADRLWKNFHISMKMATTDIVTGLYNRHYMSNHLVTQLEAGNAQHKKLSLLMLDIDHFKKINDTYGHAAGDRVLTEFGDRVLQNIRGVDLAARFGGEEFVVIMPGTDQDWALRVAERLRKCVADKPFVIEEGQEPVYVTVSIGLVTVKTYKETPHELLDIADKALYEAKDAGRNRVKVAE